MAWRYPQEVYDYIYAHHKGVRPVEMAERVNEQFGTSYTAKQMTRFYINHKLRSGIDTRFKPGNVPPQKGQKGRYVPGSEKYWFKKGGIPPTAKPMGHERDGADGYVRVKIKDRPSTVSGHDNYALKQHMVWEQYNGPVPPGCVVIFKDGNRKNFDISNLALVTRAELVRMCQNNLFSPHAEITETGIMLARLQNAIGQRRREMKEKEK